MFTAFFLQKKLAEELKKIFKGFCYPNCDGGMQEPNIFEQFLPLVDVKELADDQEGQGSGLFQCQREELPPAPYIQVILLEGITSVVDEPGVVDVLLHICAFDESKKRIGYQHLINIMQKVQERFQKDFMLDNYKCSKEIEWALADTEDHPFYFGVMAMSFEIMAVRKESEYL